MLQLRHLLAAAGFVLAASAAVEVVAQPLGLNRRSAGTDYLGDVIREGIGTGYTINNINSNTLNSSLGVTRAAGVGGGAISSAARPTLSSTPFAAGPTVKPFSSVSLDRTLSPYLALDTVTLDSNFDTYNNLVRPQLQQQRVNDQLQRQTQALNQRFQQLSAQPAFDPRGSQNAMATGHPTFYNNTLNFYPLRNQRRR